MLAEGNNREITLGPTVILGIFFALAIVCAVFFGFGYSMGRKATVAAAIVSPNGSITANSLAGSGSKPAAGNALGKDADKAPLPAPAHTPPAAASVPRPSERIVETPADTAPAEEAKTSQRPEASASTIPIPTGGSTMVQIAAVSHQEDADLLMSTLKRRGYAVVIHAEPQDKLLHVQIGPFPTHKDADAMRQRLLADGFNAIVKDPVK